MPSTTYSVYLNDQSIRGWNAGKTLADAMRWVNFMLFTSWVIRSPNGEVVARSI